MSTPLNRFAASPERSEVLGELLHVGGARPGPTLVVALDTDPLDLAGFARVSTPRPPEGENADAILAEVMSPRLSQLAYLFAPQRKELIGRPKRELITIVCREGAPVPTAAEEQFATAWRLARDQAPISRGDVYVVTPQGWACLQGGSGLEPWLDMDRASAWITSAPRSPPLAPPHSSGVLGAAKECATVPSTSWATTSPSTSMSPSSTPRWAARGSPCTTSGPGRPASPRVVTGCVAAPSSLAACGSSSPGVVGDVAVVMFSIDKVGRVFDGDGTGDRGGARRLSLSDADV